MANLPIELWHLIFNRLELTDLSSCASVSKTLYSTVKAYRVHEIAFTRRVDKWFHSTYSIYRHQVDYSMASVLKRSSFNFDYLKRLKIGRFSSIDDLNVINKFAQLEDLDIDLKNYRNEQSRTLSLAKLQVLYLFMSEHLPYLELDTPRLYSLCTFSLKGLEFFYPESVGCICAFRHIEKLTMFRNLEYLTITCQYNLLDYTRYDLKGLKEFSLSRLKKLKQIEIYVFDSFLRMNSNILRKIVGNILALGKPDLKVFWMNVQITNPDLITEYLNILENGGDIAIFQIRNCEKLMDNILHNVYDFNGFLRKLQNAGFNPRSEEFLSNLCSRYSLVRIVVNGEVKEREILMELIERSPTLRKLEFSESGLDQSFFDRMADTARMKKGLPLRSLRLKNASNVALNFNFVLRLFNLETFATDQPLSVELIFKLLKLPLLIEITFSSGKHRIQRITTCQYLLNGNHISLQELSRRFDEKPHSTVPRADERNQCDLM